MSKSLEPLFQPTQLGDIELKNALVMAPMTRSRANAEGVVADYTASYYAQRASAGLIITEGTQPSYQGQGYCRTPGIHTDAQVAAWKKVTDAVHAKGGKIAMQIMHVGRVGHPLNQVGQPGLVAPSAIAATGQMYTDQDGMVEMPVPTELSKEGIADIVAQHKRATELALKAGFDGVELHCANGYLGQQFLSSGSNTRTDEYGGSAEGRIRFVIETLQAMASVAGPGKVGIRVSPGGELQGVTDANTTETYTTLFKALEPLNLAWVHFMHTGWPQEELYALVKAPIILTGGYEADTAAKALAGSATAVGFGMKFLANPDLPERLKNGHPFNEIDYSTFFTPGEKGYTDYPAFEG